MLKLSLRQGTRARPEPLGEPRMLGMAPDCVLVDLAAEETSPALAAMLRREAGAWWVANAAGLGGGARAVDSDRAALLTVVAHRTPRGAVPVVGAGSTQSFNHTMLATSFTHQLSLINHQSHAEPSSVELNGIEWHGERYSLR